MSDVSLYRRYARALYSLAVKQGKGDVWLSQLDAFAEVCRDVRTLQAVLGNRFIDLNKRRAIVDAIALRLEIDATLVAFFKFLIDRKRFDDLPGMIRAYEVFADRDAGRLRVEVRSARTLDPATLADLGRLVEKIFKKTPKLTAHVDTRLQGGVQVAWGGCLYDGSVAGELEALRKTVA